LVDLAARRRQRAALVVQLQLRVRQPEESPNLALLRELALQFLLRLLPPDQCCRVWGQSTRMVSFKPATGWLQSIHRRKKKNGAFRAEEVLAAER
jgi:hypothetical protein